MRIWIEWLMTKYIGRIKNFQWIGCDTCHEWCQPLCLWFRISYQASPWCWGLRTLCTFSTSCGYRERRRIAICKGSIRSCPWHPPSPSHPSGSYWHLRKTKHHQCWVNMASCWSRGNRGWEKSSNLGTLLSARACQVWPAVPRHGWWWEGTSGHKIRVLRQARGLGSWALG